MASGLVRGRDQRPLYAQVADQLRDHARSRRAGDQLDSEPQLTRRLGVSRATVIKAIGRLEQEGLVRREQGRGTFVAGPRFDRRLPDLTGFTEHVTDLDHAPSQRLLDSGERDPDPADPLLSVFDGPVVVVRRLRYVDTQPVGIHRLALPRDLAARLDVPAALAGARASLYALFDRHGIALAGAQEYLRATAATPEEAAPLNAAAGTPLMSVRRFSHDADGTLLEAVDARYLGHFYDYHVRLVRTPSDQSSRREGNDGSETQTELAGEPAPAAGRVRVGGHDH